MAAERTILHLDMDAFFAAIEQRDRPELRGKPVIVGSPPDQRGVVSTCSYEARKYGVHSAMPSRTAVRLCPQGIFVPVNGKKYSLVSKQIRAIFYRYTPLVEPLSIDEAFLDISGSVHLYGGARELALDLKATILRETELTASVGIAANKFLAKLASDMEKPDGLTMVPREPAEVEAFLAPLPATRIWGVGKKSAEALHGFGLRTIGDLQRAPEQLLVRLLGESGGARVKALAHGRDEREIVVDSPEKSVSHEHTFGEDCGDWAVVERTLREMVQKVGRRLRKGRKLGTTAQIKLRWSDFTTITRQRTLPRPTHAEIPLREVAMELLAEARSERPVRLVGFGVTGLLEQEEAAEQLVQPDLFDTGAERDEQADQIDHTLDRIRAQFGDTSIRRGLD